VLPQCVVLFTRVVYCTVFKDVTHLTLTVASQDRTHTPMMKASAIELTEQVEEDTESYSDGDHANDDESFDSPLRSCDESMDFDKDAVSFEDEESVYEEPSMSRTTYALIVVPFICLAIAMAAVFGIPNGVLSTTLRGETVDATTVTDTEVVHHVPDNLDSEQSTHMRANDTSYYVTKLASKQIQRYRDGKALMINVAINNHGGNAVCQTLGHATNAPGDVPRSHCSGVAKDQVEEAGYPGYYPWMYEESHSNLHFVRQYFHMISWRFAHPAQEVLISDTDWEDENLVSILVIRHPLERLLSHDFGAEKQWPGVFGLAQESEEDLKTQWWVFARSKYTDNFALRILAGRECCDGKTTDRKHIESAKNLLKRFTFILDMECLDAGLKAAGNLLGLNFQNLQKRQVDNRKPRERMYNEEIFHFLNSKNRMDIELYEWAKTRALVQCHAP